MDMQAAQALVRFGLGRRGAEPAPTDPARWLASQLQGPDPARIASAPSTATGLAALRAERERRKAARTIAATAAMMPGAIAGGQPARRAEASPARAVFEADAKAELDNALSTPAPFRERLVWFWTNHFTVSIRQGGCAPLVGAFIEEA